VGELRRHFAREYLVVLEEGRGGRYRPIFRSEAQARILAWLLLDTDRERPISQFAQVAGLLSPTQCVRSTD
jgi:hypothetical protein